MMQGLLDFIKTPEGQGLLSGVFGYAANARRGTPINNLGRGGVAGLLGYSNAIDRQDQQAENQWLQKYRQMQMDEMQRKLAEQRSQEERTNAWIASQNPTARALSNGAGPTQANASQIDPIQQQAYELLRSGVMTPSDYAKQFVLPKERKLMTVKPGDMVLDENNPTKPLFSAPEQVDPNKPFMLVDGKIVANPDFQQFELEKASRSAARNSTTTINNVDTTGRAFWGDFGKGQADALIQEGQAARTGMGTIKMIDDVVPRLSQAFTGPGAEYRNTAVGALRSIGIDIDEKRFGNTQYIQKQLGEVVLGKIKQLGANPSNADLTFINQTVPRINDDPKALTDLLMFMRQKEVERVQGYNAKIEQLRRNPASQGIPYGLDPLSVPEMPKVGAGSTPLPPNPSAQNLKRDVVYDTPRGPAKWDGFKFNLVK